MPIETSPLNPANKIKFSDAISGSAPTITVIGSDPDADLVVEGHGDGNIVIKSHGKIVFDTHGSGATAVNWIRAFNEPTGVGAALGAVGLDPDVDLLLLGQGTGKVKAWDGTTFQEVATLDDIAGAVDTEMPAGMHAAPAKATPADADEFPVLDSVTGFSLKKWTLANLKTLLATWLEDLVGVWTNKTLVNPKITTILDTNGNIGFDISAAAAAVNWIRVYNEPAGVNGAAVGAVGADPNVDLLLLGQGTGAVKAWDGSVFRVVANTTDLATKVDKTTTAYRVYGTDNSGAPYFWVMDSTGTTPTSIPFRDPDGNIAVGTPNSANDATPMTYVDAGDTAAKARANHTGTQTSATISDFAEAAQDALAAALGGASGVTVSYNDAANTITITGIGDTTTQAEAIRDAIGVALVGVGNISIVVDDPGDTITISTSATVNSTDAALRDRSTHTGSQLAATISDFATAVAAAATASSTANSVVKRDANGRTAFVDPAAQSDAATKQYADNKIHQVRCATTSVLSFTIASGSVTQITGLTVDGITVAVNDLILVKDAPSATGAGSANSTQPGNGLYIVTSLAGGNIAVSRAPELSGTVLPYGHIFRILEGTLGPSSSNFGRVYGVLAPLTGAFTWGTTAIGIGNDFFAGFVATALYASGSYRAQRISNNVSATTPAINMDNVDVFRNTALAANMTTMTVTGTLFAGHVLTMEFTDNGVARTLTRSSTFISGTAPMATTTIPGSTIRERYIYVAASAKYECFESVVVGAAQVKNTEYSNASTSATVSGTGNIPPGAVGVKVNAKLGGQGGGSGRRGAAGTVRTGGGGGGGAPAIVDKYMPIPAGVTTYTYSLGPVGVGGAAVTADSTNGNAGTTAGTVSFTLNGVVERLSTAGPLTTLAGAGGSTVSSGNAALTAGGGALWSSGGSSSNTGAAGNSGFDSWSQDVPSGAGAGGGITSGDVPGAGAIGGFHRGLSITQATGGAVDSTLPTGGGAIDTSGAGLAGTGAGGGAASITAAAQAGANGVGYGSPGGGGGASLNGFNSGKGGDGGPAYMRLEWVYA